MKLLKILTAWAAFMGGALVMSQVYAATIDDSGLSIAASFLTGIGMGSIGLIVGLLWGDS